MIPLSGRVPGRASEPSRTRVDDGGGYGTFRGWRLGSLGFCGRRHYIGERAASGGTRGGHATPWRSRRWGRAGPWRGCLLGRLRLSFGLRVRVGKIEGSVQVSSNSENISRTAFLEYKNSRKQELALWYLTTAKRLIAATWLVTGKIVPVTSKYYQ